MIKISVIIPVYKVEAYLQKCVYSVLNQNHKDIEIILVNDGSPDNCPKMCDEFGKLDSRVRVIHQANGGSSSARNTGIKVATGSYILFLDSDDYWEGKDCLENLVNTISSNKADIILYGTKDVNLNSNTEVVSRGWYDIPAIQKNKESAIQSLFNTGHFPGSAWIFAVKRSLVIKNDLFFIKGIKAEDIDWLLNVFTHAKTLDAVNDTFYMYIKNRPGSITNTSDLKSAKDILFSVTKWHNILKENLILSNKLLLSFLSFQYFTALIIYSKLKKKERGLLRPILKKEKGILKYSYGKKGMTGKYLVKFLGINASSNLFRFIHESKFKRASKK